MSVLGTETFGGAGNLGGNWTNDSSEDGAWQQGSGVGTPSALGYSLAFFTGAAAIGDQYAQIRVNTVFTTTDQGCGPAVRGNTGAAGDVYFAQTNTTETRLYKRVSTTFTLLGSAAPCVANDILYISAVGSSISVKINGTDVINVSDGSIATGRGAIWGVNGGTIDDFEVGDFGSQAGEIVSNIQDVIGSGGTRPRPFAPGNAR